MVVRPILILKTIDLVCVNIFILSNEVTFCGKFQTLNCDDRVSTVKSCAGGGGLPSEHLMSSRLLFWQQTLQPLRMVLDFEF